MCGIAGYFAYGSDAPPCDPSALKRIADAMLTRGPDGSGAWQSEDGRIAFAHRRLAIIDLSETGAQPMTSADGRYVITYNGEIYNFRELRRELEAEGRVFVSQSDTEVLLQLYDRDGENMVGRLRGMFAFAIWDSARRGVFMARDPYGIKPLYYADDGRSVRFASQVKALLAGGEIDTRPAPAGHVGFFVFGYVPEPETLYRGIRALPSGHTIWIDGDGARPPKKFFDIGALLRDTFERKDDVSSNELLHDALRDSVAHHLVSDVPVGVFLSAGLDSTTIAALASEHETEGIRAITLGFEEFKSSLADETPLAALVAEHYGAVHDTRWVRRADFTGEVERITAAMDQPTIDGVNTYFVSKAAAEAGLKVALSGLGGDEMFGGYASFRDIPRVVSVLGLLRYLPGLGRGIRIVGEPMIRRFVSPKYAGLLEYGSRPGDFYLLYRAVFPPWELPKVLDPDLVREGWRELAAQARLAQTIDGLVSPRAIVSALESSWYMRSQLLRDSDWAGMAHSLEIRVPLVDATLLSRLAPLIAGPHPPDKLAMAAAPAKPLPDGVLNRPKTGFLIPVRDWLAADAGVEERGLQGWARMVYGAHAGTDLLN
jgi:asparagine synthase (glutamine-hydrolysing)